MPALSEGMASHLSGQLCLAGSERTVLAGQFQTAGLDYTISKNSLVTTWRISMQ